MSDLREPSPARSRRDRCLESPTDDQKMHQRILLDPRGPKRVMIAVGVCIVEFGC